jgi:hypothetical protein
VDDEWPRVPLDLLRRGASGEGALGGLRLEWPYYNQTLHARMLKVLRPGDPGYSELASGDYHAALRANGIEPEEITRTAEEYRRARAKDIGELPE